MGFGLVLLVCCLCVCVCVCVWGSALFIWESALFICFIYLGECFIYLGVEVGRRMLCFSFCLVLVFLALFQQVGVIGFSAFKNIVNVVLLFDYFQSNL